MKKNLFYSGLIVLFIFAAGCKKGDTGAPGTNGTNGNANVETYVFTNQAWGGNANNYIELNVAAITQNVLDNGAVIIYFKEHSTYSYAWESSDPDFDTQITLSHVTFHKNTPSITLPYDIKVVVIPAP